MSSWRENPNLVLEDEGAYEEFIEEIGKRVSIESSKSDPYRHYLFYTLLPTNGSSTVDVRERLTVTHCLNPKAGAFWRINYHSPYSHECEWTVDHEFVGRCLEGTITTEENNWMGDLKQRLISMERGW